MFIQYLPAINATLNAIATALLIYGYLLIKQKKVDAHKRAMISSFLVSTLFLIFYILDKTLKAVDTQRTVNISPDLQGAPKTIYLIMLASHVILAMIVPVFAILLIKWGLAGNFQKHKKLARYAFPIWLYVSITGVIIYFILYQWFPPINNP